MHVEGVTLAIVPFAVVQVRTTVFGGGGGGEKWMNL